LRRSLLGPLSDLNSEQYADDLPANIQFMEVAPENWIGLGGRLGKQFSHFTERYDFVAHGLSLSLGGPLPLDFNLLADIKHFIKHHKIRIYSEHLSYCGDHGHLYDLLPIPFTNEAVHYVADRIRQVQDFLEQEIAIENISYYATPAQQMSEIDFLNAVLEEANCKLLLDVNNIYVNSVNHCYDPNEFLNSIPGQRIAYIHIAGHYDEAEDLKIDTHGANVKADVWDLLADTYRKHGIIPTLLERDFNIPPVSELLLEVKKIQTIQNRLCHHTSERLEQGANEFAREQ